MARAVLEEGIKLEINVLRRAGLIWPGADAPPRSLALTDGFGRRAGVGIVATTGMDEAQGQLRLEARGSAHVIGLTAVAQEHGARWLFLCPQTGARCSVLWLPPGESSFGSRQAFAGRSVAAVDGLKPHRRAELAALRIRLRLKQAGSIALGDPLPPRPARMSRRVYAGLIDQLVEAEGRADAMMLRQVERMLR